MEKIKSRLMCVLLMLCSLTVFSCGGDDDEEDNGGGSGKDLIGTWEETRSEGYEMDKSGKKYPFDHTSEPGNVITLKADGTFEIDEDGERATTGKWSYSGGVLTMKSGAESLVVKILSLTSTSFVMEYTQKYSSGGELYSKHTFRRME